ncbi:MAG: hypothetical protein JXB15_12080 [Anaerolineales bacterium]|nr:hypothetical protein [Anaerolineales bacterium]
MTDKAIGFNRHVFLAWLDEAAALCCAGTNSAEARAHLEAILAVDTQGAETRRKAIDILLNIWLHTRQINTSLWQDAAEKFKNGPASERIWLHYGLTLAAYPFVRECLRIIGQFERAGSTFTKVMLRDRLIAQRGQLGSLERSLRYVLASLRQWGVVAETEQQHVYQASPHAFSTDQADLELWLMACALHAHPAEEISFADLLRLPELFPFRITVGIDALRTDARFRVQRQGSGWEMVRLTY